MRLFSGLQKGLESQGSAKMRICDRRKGRPGRSLARKAVFKNCEMLFLMLVPSSSILPSIPLKFTFCDSYRFWSPKTKSHTLLAKRWVRSSDCAPKNKSSSGTRQFCQTLQDREDTRAGNRDPAHPRERPKSAVYE